MQKFHGQEILAAELAVFFEFLVNQINEKKMPSMEELNAIFQTIKLNKQNEERFYEAWKAFKNGIKTI